ncbi:NYN domain-containing protein [Aceticella autotrophica]|uniref:NYN domain-containing protein n=1 Tax=Aceticella autotrophica TaxID=2755338 RepID=A0A975GAD7_9THEO|nr:NYN domain-containing protein [Aceticella autotrophica]QSZ27175.1 NYN domain-containing protein [Aceticella autotrophica]
MYMILDGYNIINNWSELKKEAEDNLEDARLKLIEMLINFQGYSGIKIIVVYDALYVKGSVEKHEYYNNVEVVYTKEGETADHYIEGIIKTLAKKEQVVVVTSDWALQQVVLGEGATRMSSRELHDDLIKYFNEKKKYFVVNNLKNNIESMLDEDVLKKLRKMSE